MAGSEAGPQRDPSVPEISVIVPTSVGADRLPSCLNSLVRQDLAASRYEVIVVQHGPDDGTAQVVSEFHDRRPGLDIRHVVAGMTTRAAAKNAGIRTSACPRLVFVHDGDRVSTGFLTGLLSTPVVADRITLGVVVDDPVVGPADLSAAGVQRLLAQSGRVVSPPTIGSMLSRGRGIAFPRAMLRAFGLDDDLAVAEDSVLLGRLLSAGSLDCAVPSAARDVVYYESDRTGSVGADTDPRRLVDGLQRLAELPPACGLDSMRRELGRWGTAEVNQYLQTHPEDHRSVIRERRQRDLGDVMPLRVLNRRLARDLAVLYTAVPYVDTSANVAARRILDREVVVDVISNNMSSRLSTDPSSEAIWAEFVDRRMTVATRPSDTWWPGVTAFCRKGLAAISKQERLKGPYRSVYSRVMHPTSHFLAALLKLRRPELTWCAELSDPVRHDVKGRERPSHGKPHPVIMADLRAGLRSRGVTLPANDNLYLWLETLTYALADEITFTNENQRAFMLDRFPDRNLAERAATHSVVKHHPRPDPRLYTMIDSSYDLPRDKVNLAYFGVFYATRGLTEVWQALQQLSSAQRRVIMLHVFTSKPHELTDELARADLSDVVRANPYVGYLEYLNLAARSDVLIVNDAKTAGIHERNPYLPSKWSDYAGSGSKIWGIVEQGSVLSGCPLDYRSELGDVNSAIAVLSKIIDVNCGPRTTSAARR